MVVSQHSKAFERVEGLTDKEIKLMQFREWARDLVGRAQNGAMFLESYESPDDVCLKLQREFAKPEPK